MSESVRKALLRALVAANVVPPDSELPIDGGANLLVTMRDQWSRRATSCADASGRDRASCLAAWCNARLLQGAHLSVGIPSLNEQVQDRWLQTRLMWWPNGVCSRSLVGVVSSRLGQRLESYQSWFAMLRTVCARLSPESDVLLCAHKTTPAQFVERSSQLFGITRLVIAETRCDSLRQWFSRVTRQSGGEPRQGVFHLLPSPVIVPSTNTRWGEGLSEVPLRDRMLFAMSDVLVALYVRSGGNIERLCRQRLGEREFRPGSTWIALANRLTERRLADELIANGAVGYVLADKYENESSRFGMSMNRTDSVAPAVKPPAARKRARPTATLVNFEGFLTHCTRRRRGPWPGQSRADYLDDYILDRPSRDHSPLAALKRMLAQQKVVASSEGIRGGHGVVSFTAVPLRELHRLRVFRIHRLRWDFEPYGICIRREWLAARGARPVKYASNQQWVALPEEMQPFFQLVRTRGNASSTGIDWTVEQEWRMVGDVPLSAIAAGDAFVFVPSQTEADELRPLSRWPVHVLATDWEAAERRSP